MATNGALHKMEDDDDELDEETIRKITEEKRAKREPISLEQLASKMAAEEAAKAKPVFLTKEMRAAEALKRRQEEVAEKRRQQEEERKKRIAFMEEAKQAMRAETRDSYRDRDRVCLTLCYLLFVTYFISHLGS